MWMDPLLLPFVCGLGLIPFKVGFVGVGTWPRGHKFKAEWNCHFAGHHTIDSTRWVLKPHFYFTLIAPHYPTILGLTGMGTTLKLNPSCPRQNSLDREIGKWARRPGRVREDEVRPGIVVNGATEVLPRPNSLCSLWLTLNPPPL